MSKLQPLPTIDAAIPAAEIQLPCVIYLAADGCKPLAFSVDSLTVAAQAFIAYRDIYNLGASQMAAHCGHIYGADRKTLVARISYNGRAWSPTGELLAEAPDAPTEQPLRHELLQEFSVVIKVQATDCRHAVELACERLNQGGEPDAVLTCPITFPDPENPESTVTL